jgi:hypothetical protein
MQERKEKERNKFLMFLSVTDKRHCFGRNGEKRKKENGKGVH